jgi:3-deoxy-7-phosphoheptulonate synthase
MVDCSHANSDKDYRRQADVARVVADQIAGGDHAIFGVMLESFLIDGRQEVREGSPLTHGQSITDACMGWDRTRPVFDLLAQAVRKRRSAS